MVASNNDTEMADVSTQSKLQTPIEIEESEPLNPDGIVVDLQPETQDDSDGQNIVDKEIELSIEDGKTKEKKWMRQAKLQFNHSKMSFFLNMVLPGIDEGTDVFSAIMHFINCNPFYGGLTVYLTVQPAIFAAISKKNPRELLDHLPFIHLKKHWELQKEIAELQEKVSKYPDSSSVWTSLLQTSETELQDVKIFTSMGESAPQFILALLIVIKQGSLEDWILELNPMVNPIGFLQMSTSLASTVLAVTGLFTDLEVNGETPVRNKTYKFGKILPLMSLKSIPRLFSLSLSFSFASIYNWKNLIFHILYTLSILSLYGISYFGLCAYLKRGDKSLRGLGFKGFFTTIIAPCMIGSFYSSYFMLTFLLSDVFHCINLGGLWVTSIYFPSLLSSPSYVNNCNTTTNITTNSIPQSEIDQFSTFQMYCMILILVLMGSILISYLMLKLYKTMNKTTIKKAHISLGKEKAIEKMVKKSEVNFNSAIPGDYHTPVTYAAQFSGSTEDEPGVALQFFVNNHSQWSIDFNIQDNRGKMNALMTSAFNGNAGNVKLLLAQSAELDLNLNAVNEYDVTALMLACQSYNPQVISPFLECAKAKNINVNARDKWDKSAFFLACEKTAKDNKIERLEILIKFAKDLDMDLMTRNKKGKTGFDLLSLATREKLSGTYPDLVPDEDTLLSDQ